MGVEIEVRIHHHHHVETIDMEMAAVLMTATTIDSTRDITVEMTCLASTTKIAGPRGGWSDPPTAAGASREMFQPRSSRSTAQDPNYGRLNQPADPAPPSGPRSDRPNVQSQPSTPGAPIGPASSLPVGIHPSRLDNIQRMPPGPPLQTNMPNAPSGPRGTGRGPQNTLPSPVGRGTPTGPAANDRVQRGGDRRNPLGAINSVLTQNAPVPDTRPSERPADTPQNPPVRGRGASRVNAPTDGSGGMSSPMLPPVHNSTPNARAEMSHHRNGRGEPLLNTPQDDGRLESHSGHRDTRRSDRSGRERSRSTHRNDRHGEERSTRNGLPVVEDRSGERERGSGRDKRGSERDGSTRRDRSEREGVERTPRESRDSGSRRERSSRDDGGRPREERRSRGGGSTDEGRKRGRDGQDQGHGDMKRRR
ncbi:THO2 plays a role in transcriptional elongation [Pleosporales sp. CAS-2024a]